ncbi:hypothetical protein JTB14_036907 [Gonioctena quinquepunctata]|nr:hypothetical protein JTB14_036907 [Gonioctena quinquepunctata]
MLLGSDGHVRCVRGGGRVDWSILLVWTYAAMLGRRPVACAAMLRDGGGGQEWKVNVRATWYKDLHKFLRISTVSRGFYTDLPGISTDLYGSFTNFYEFT